MNQESRIREEKNTTITASFLQSSEWEESQKLEGRKMWRSSGVLIIRHDLPAGFNYLYCPHPAAVTKKLLADIAEIAREEKAIFLKVDPQENLPPTTYDLRPATSLQPRKTVVIDLKKSEGELLAAMHEKTRYNIRLAERRGVGVFKYSSEERKNLPDLFFKLLKETAAREGFHAHEREHYEKLLAIRSENFRNELFFAEYERKVVAAAIVNFYKPSATAIYLHGASSREHKEIMAPHLIHWRIIEEAKRLGFSRYDMWGIDEKRWPGITRFKKGFGGREVEYPDSFDIIYRKNLYELYGLAKKFLLLTR